MKNFSGLTSEQANEKLKEYGPNELKESNKFSTFKIFVRQIKKNMLIYLLFAAALMSFFVGKYITGYAILGVIFVVVVAGFISDQRIEWGPMTAIGVMMVIPVLLFAIFTQKYLVRGLTFGAVKG